MRLDWKGEDHGGPFTSAQSFDLRDLLPERATLLAYLSVRRVGEPTGTGFVTALLQVKDQQGVTGQLRASVALFDEGSPTTVALGVFHKMAKDAQSAESELLLLMVPDEGASGVWSVDVGIP
jgi:hypothetical protein